MTSSTSERISADRSCRFRCTSPGKLRLAVEVTRACNLRCAHCFVPHDGISPSLPDLERALRGLAAVNAGKVILTGGEPLLRPDLERVVHACAVQGLAVDLNSNLMDLTEQRARRLIHAGLSEASASLYGDRDFHDRFVGAQGAWSRAVKGIRILRALNVTIDVHCALAGQALPRLAEFAAFCTSMGCASLTFFTLIAPAGDPYAFPAGFAPALRALGASCNIPVRTVGLSPFDNSECVMGDGIVGLTAALEWQPCLLARGCCSHSLQAGRITLPEVLGVLRESVGDGEWHPACRPAGVASREQYCIG
jgi:hypothetical protein